MTAKQTKASKKVVAPASADTPMVDKSKLMKVVYRPGATEDRVLAEHALNPATANAVTALEFSRSLYSGMSLQDCVMVVKDDIESVNGGNLDKLEGMLTAQAIALNAMFNNFANRAIQADVMPKLDTYFRLALKAQSQCRSTVEAIAEIKYPKSATFIKQANIAQQQQVNNGAAKPLTETHAHERNITPTNELLTEASSATLDTRGTIKAGRTDTKLEALEAINRTDNRKRKSAGIQ
jgi:hypothetical protein